MRPPSQPGGIRPHCGMTVTAVGRGALTDVLCGRCGSWSHPALLGRSQSDILVPCEDVTSTCFIQHVIKQGFAIPEEDSRGSAQRAEHLSREHRAPASLNHGEPAPGTLGESWGSAVPLSQWLCLFREEWEIWIPEAFHMKPRCQSV